FVHDFFAFFDEAHHAVALLARRFFAETLKYFLQAFDVSAGLLKMSFETRAQVIGRRGLCQFRQSLHQSIFGVVDVFQFVDIEISQSVMLHGIPSPRTRYFVSHGRAIAKVRAKGILRPYVVLSTSRDASEYVPLRFFSMLFFAKFCRGSSSR